MIRFPRRPAAGPAAKPADDGFVLLESIIAISLVTVIMTALASFFVNTLASTSQQRARQTATQIATSAVETVRGVQHPSDLLNGRDFDTASTQFNAASAVVSPWFESMHLATDAAAVGTGSGPTATIPTVAIVSRINNINYRTNTYLGWCGVLANGTDCNGADETNGIRYLRAVVAVTWSDTHCTSGTCTYVTATLLSAADDPTFNLNLPPPALPIVVDPGNQTSAVNDTVSLQLTVQSGTGVPFFTWRITAGSLPAGLAMNPAGLISGTPTTQVTNLSVTVTATDQFTREDPDGATFTWTILPPLVVTPPGNQANTTAGAITTLTLTATGGSGGYVWTDPGATLPPGLSISTVSGQGKVNGTPTVVGVYNVQLTVKDSKPRASTVNFTWTITYPPIAGTNPGTQVSTVNTAIASLQMSASGGSGSFTWTGAANLPAGLGMTTGGLITGTPTTVSSKSVALTVTDNLAGYQQVVTFTWAIVLKPTIAAPTTLSTTEGITPAAIALAYTCPNQPCTITLVGTVPGLGLNTASTFAGNNTTTSLNVAAASGTVYINGTVQATAVTTGNSLGYSPSLTITDVDGASVNSAAASWTIFAPPTTTALAARTTTEGARPSVAIGYTCPNTSCTITLAGTVPGLGLSAVAANSANNTTLTLAVGAGSGTAYINGTVQNNAVTTGTSKAYNPSVTIKDVVNISSTATTALWTAYTVPTLSAVTAQTGTRGVADTVTITFTCPNVSCGLTLSGAPAGLGLNLSNTTAAQNATNTANVTLALSGTSGTFYVNGKIGGAIAVGTYTLTVTITDAGGVAVPRTFTWVVV